MFGDIIAYNSIGKRYNLKRNNGNAIMEKLSVFITTFNNQDTLPTCIESVKWADEIVVLDSFSNDKTLEIALANGCVVSQHKFMGYGPQKQMALEATTYNWVLLMDADEELSGPLQKSIQDLMKTGFDADGYEIPRQEQLFWKMCSTKVRLNYYLRLFNKNKGFVSTMPVHAAPKVKGEIKKLKHVFYHYGERSIHIKVEKINSYSTGLVEDKVRKKKNPWPWVKLVLYPPFAFIRSYIFKRNFLNGWAGFITSVTMAFYAFLKYAKLYEYQQIEKYGARQLPPGAPEHQDKSAKCD